MLSAKDNEALTRVGRGTPMGELMRRYWQPIAAVARARRARRRCRCGCWARTSCSTRTSGTLRPARSPLPASPRRPLVRHCRGVRAALPLSWLALRRDGPVPGAAVRGRRASRGRFRDKIRITAYPVEAKAGPAVGVSRSRPRRRWCRTGSSSADQGYEQIVFSEVPCNWFQGQENSIDPVHFEWMHGNWAAARAARTARVADATSSSRSMSSSGASSIAACARIRPSRTIYGPSAACASGRTACSPAHFEWRVPIDDEHTLTWRGSTIRVPGTRAVRAGAHSVLVRAGHRPVDRPLAHQPRDEPGLRRLGGAGNDRRPHAGASGRERSRRHPVSQAHARGGRDRRAAAASPRRSCATR